MWPIKVYTAETLVTVDATIVEFSKIMNVKEYYIVIGICYDVGKLPHVKAS